MEKEKDPLVTVRRSQVYATANEILLLAALMVAAVVLIAYTLIAFVRNACV